MDQDIVRISSILVQVLEPFQEIVRYDQFEAIVEYLNLFGWELS